MTVLTHPITKASEWIRELADALGVDDASAWSCLRAGLHALRDRLPVDESAHLAAQLPLIVRGLYFEGWQPSSVPVKVKDRAHLGARVEAELRGTSVSADAVLHAVFDLLRRHVTGGQIDVVRHALPSDLQSLFARH
jgi:uncharacterized protein (DUF2267 family)